ncbi:DUF2975 domain-containing protein [Streptomyces sp. NPDC000151]|uniref:DUF2975 domain-containing protein n=1 Tax=Streptomyces sp. NPDC000151 TaxID=3154244 RepID=UPI00331DCA5B
MVAQVRNSVRASARFSGPHAPWKVFSAVQAQTQFCSWSRRAGRGRAGPEVGRPLDRGRHLFSVGRIVVIPSTAADAADEVEQFPAYAPYAIPYVVVATLGVACVQVALVAVWGLLGMVRHGAIFTPREPRSPCSP